MSPELLRLVLDRYPRAARVSLIGVGEPLLSPYFFELVRECDKRRLTVDTVSNGYNLEGHIPDIVRSGLNCVVVSVNGHTPDEFHRMTGMRGECHSRILQNARALVRARGNKIHPRVEVSFIIDKYNWCYMGQMIEIGEEVGADGVLLNQFLPSPFPGFTPEERCLYASDPVVRDELARLMSKRFGCVVKWPDLLGQPEDDRRICKCPFSLLVVDGGGNVGGCPAMMLNLHGNGTVHDEDPWNNEHFRDLRRRHLQGDLCWPCNYCVENAGVDPKRFAKKQAAS
jgi:MoaA/NifB/PqqE/SkfB family radical SAM enzyme